MEITKRNYINLIKIILIVLIGLLLLGGYKTGLISLIIVPFFWALFLAYLLNPLVNLLERFRLKRSLAITAVYLIIVFLGYIIIKFLLPGLVEDLKQLVSDVPSYTNKLIAIVEKVRTDVYNSNLPKGINGIITDKVSNAETYLVRLINSALNWGTKFVSSIFDIVLIPVITFYILKDSQDLKKWIRVSFPIKYRPMAVLIVSDINKVISRFVRSQLIVGVFVGTLTSVAMGALGVNFAILIGLIAGVLEIIPFFGSIVSGIIAILIAFLDNPIKAVWVAITVVLIQQIEGNIVSPKVMGDSLGLHPLTVMFSVIIGGKYFGILGMLLSVPAICIIKVLFKRLYNPIRDFLTSI